MFRGGLYARVSTKDQQTLPDAEACHARVKPSRRNGLDQARAGAAAPERAASGFAVMIAKPRQTAIRISAITGP